MWNDRHLRLLVVFYYLSTRKSALRRVFYASVLFAMALAWVKTWVPAPCFYNISHWSVHLSDEICFFSMNLQNRCVKKFISSIFFCPNGELLMKFYLRFRTQLAHMISNCISFIFTGMLNHQALVRRLVKAVTRFSNHEPIGWAIRWPKFGQF